MQKGAGIPRPNLGCDLGQFGWIEGQRVFHTVRSGPSGCRPVVEEVVSDDRQRRQQPQSDFWVTKYLLSEPTLAI